MADDEISLPKATVGKVIKGFLDGRVSCSSEAQELIVECCLEFIKSFLSDSRLISSEANEVSTLANKNVILPEHIIAALKY
jgi:histone H3/H4